MNKKGLSTIVTTLIVILLVLVAIGIIWVVISGFIRTGTGQIDIDSKCLGIDVRPIRVDSACSATACTVTVERSAGGVSEAVNTRVYLSDGTHTANKATTIDQLATASVSFAATDMPSFTAPTKATVVAYFMDAQGNPVLCKNPQEYTIA